MLFIWILLGIAAVGAVALWFCFYMAFYSPSRTPLGPEDFPIPAGVIYEPHREAMVGWMRQVRAMPCRELSVKSFDGLTLRGKFYCFRPDAPIELMFHGYRGHSERDLCGGVQRCFKLGHSALIVDQRGCGRSDGHVISFGINECRDCHTWVAHAIELFGSQVPLLLTGISMGAATVLMAAGSPLPPSVVGVLADCGYDTAPNIIKRVIPKMHLPVRLAYPLVRLAGRLFGGFDIEDASPLDAIARCKLPIILFHGEDDAFVPCDMSRNLYACRPGNTRLVTVPGAGHGLSYLIDPKGYLQNLQEFWDMHIPENQEIE